MKWNGSEFEVQCPTEWKESERTAESDALLVISLSYRKLRDIITQDKVLKVKKKLSTTQFWEGHALCEGKNIIAQSEKWDSRSDICTN
jgi:hypothetical protein